MQTDWLIDFMTLAQTRSFSRAAQLRRITQPAFSRRIRALESWAMATLVDRVAHPLQLTPAGQRLLADAPALTNRVRRTQAMLEAHIGERREEVRIAAPHLLAQGFLPAWIQERENLLGNLNVRLLAHGPPADVAGLVQGDLDVLLTWRWAGSAPEPQDPRWEAWPLGQERLLPCSRPGPDGLPLHGMADGTAASTPYLAHAPSTGIDTAIRQSLATRGLERTIRTAATADDCTVLKALTQAGLGVAFLPARCVQPELDDGRLLPVPAWPQLTLDVAALRLRPDPSRRCQPAVDRLWLALKRSPQNGPPPNGASSQKTPARAFRNDGISATLLPG
ncbi:LysR family transcriptional regulator [Hydrogenophaga sp.]|uniref:LysR family transcriptional regulator n=1 Tax=Hydrogenophaga sp. TaxID=1904254 RepID=UPI00261BC4FD|nr:LysR family transcriptional regulator [Hydrogenophaga sp.]MCW5655238.1 LysR family transcriptional regulator [Hydrogenophaga sp.]